MSYNRTSTLSFLLNREKRINKVLIFLDYLEEKQALLPDSTIQMPTKIKMLYGMKTHYLSIWKTQRNTFQAQKWYLQD